MCWQNVSVLYSVFARLLCLKALNQNSWSSAHLQIVSGVHHDSWNSFYWFTKSCADMLFITIFNKVQSGKISQKILESKFSERMHITVFWILAKFHKSSETVKEVEEEMWQQTVTLFNEKLKLYRKKMKLELSGSIHIYTFCS